MVPGSKPSVLDTCVVLNLFASGTFEEVVATWPHPVAVSARAFRSEALYTLAPGLEPGQREKVPLDLSQFVASGALMYGFNAFFSIRRTVSGAMESTTFRATSSRLSSFSVQRARPGGGGEQASRASSVWAAPSSLGGRGLRCRAAAIPSQTQIRAWRARYMVMAVMPTAAACSSVQAGPSSPWSQSSPIWARHWGRGLGEPVEINRFRYVRSSESSSTKKHFWDKGALGNKGGIRSAAGTSVGVPPLRVAPYFDTRLAYWAREGVPTRRRSTSRLMKLTCPGSHCSRATSEHRLTCTRDSTAKIAERGSKWLKQTHTNRLVIDKDVVFLPIGGLCAISSIEPVLIFTFHCWIGWAMLLNCCFNVFIFLVVMNSTDCFGEIRFSQ